MLWRGFCWHSSAEEGSRGKSQWSWMSRLVTCSSTFSAVWWTSGGSAPTCYCYGGVYTAYSHSGVCSRGPGKEISMQRMFIWRVINARSGMNHDCFFTFLHLVSLHADIFSELLLIPEWTDAARDPPCFCLILRVRNKRKTLTHVCSSNWTVSISSKWGQLEQIEY